MLHRHDCVLCPGPDRDSDPRLQDCRVVDVCGPLTFRNLIVFIYPVYASFKALKSDDKEDDTQWLSYWVIYALLNVLESIPMVVKAIPYYALLRVIALVLCFLPQVQVGNTPSVSFLGC